MVQWPLTLVRYNNVLFHAGLLKLHLQQRAIWALREMATEALRKAGVTYKVKQNSPCTPMTIITAVCDVWLSV